MYEVKSFTRSEIESPGRDGLENGLVVLDWPSISGSLNEPLSSIKLLTIFLELLEGELLLIGRDEGLGDGMGWGEMG